MDSIPKTINGKIDKAKLVLPKTEYEFDKSTNGEIWTTKGKLIKKIWDEILEGSVHSEEDNFFTLGGDSLGAIHMLGRLRYELNIDVPLSLFFINPTIKNIMQYDNESEETSHNLDKIISQHSDLNECKLSMPQKSFWFYSFISPTNVFYNVIAKKLEGNLSVSDLERAIRIVADGNDSFKMTFHAGVNDPYVAFSQSGNVSIITKDLTEEHEKYNMMYEIAKKEINKPFDLSNGPLLRCIIFKMKKNEHILFMNMHHIISDGLSCKILLEQISKVYRDLIDGKIENQDFLHFFPSLQYKEYILWQDEVSKKDIFIEQEQHWRTKLKDIPDHLGIIGDYKRPKIFTYRGDTITVDIKRETTKKIKEFVSRNNCTMYMFFLGLYGVLLSKYSGQENVVVGMPVSGRNEQEFENVVGCFVNTIALPIHISGQETFDKMILNVKETLIDGIENSDISFDSVVSALNPKRDLSRTPVFQAMIAMQESWNEGLDLPNIKISDTGIVNDIAPCDISIVILNKKEGISLYVEYYADVYNKQTIEQMMGHYLQVIEDVLTRPSKKIDELHLAKQPFNTSLKLDEDLKTELNFRRFSEYKVLNERGYEVSPNMPGHLFGIQSPNSELVDLDHLVYYDHEKRIHRLREVLNDLTNEKKSIANIADEERIIKEVWEKILKKEISSVEHNVSFFDLGGDSLKLIIVLQQLNKKYPFLSLIDMFKYPTINSLAQYITKN